MKTGKATLLGLFVLCCFRAVIAIIPIWLVLMLGFKLCYHQYPPLKFLPVFFLAIVFGDLLGVAVPRLFKPKSKV